MRNRYVLLADLSLITLCALGAFVLRLDWFFVEYQVPFRFFLVASLLVKPPTLFVFGLYRRYWRYASVRDLSAVVLGVSAASLLLSAIVLASLWWNWVDGFPRSVLVIDWGLTLIALGGLRLSARIVAETFGATAPMRGDGRRVLVVGAGDAGALVVRELQRNPQLRLSPVGFLDDDPVKRGKRILGVPIVGTLRELRLVVGDLAAQEVLIAMPRVGGGVVRSIVEECQRLKLPAKVLPGVYELLDGQVSVSRLRTVEISDLLRRPPVVGPPDAAAYVRGRVVLVTGAGGSIGSELCRQLAGAGASTVVLFGHGENSLFEAEARLRAEFPDVRLATVVGDVRDRERLARAFASHGPEVVFHAAAHKHVPLMETNPEEAVTNNVIGTRNVVEAALAAGVQRFVLISTDKAVSPSSVMGASKRVAEALVRQAAKTTGRAFVTVRFGNVLGSRGSVVPVFKQQIERGGPVTVTHPEMTRFFMTIPEAVHLVLEAGGKGKGGELYVLNMGQPVKIVDLARDLIRLSGLSPEEVQISFTGLRPGEKLSEELWDPGAVIEPTDNPEILRVSESKAPDQDLLAFVDELSRAAQRGDSTAVRRLLLSLSAEHTPSSQHTKA